MSENEINPEDLDEETLKTIADYYVQQQVIEIATNVLIAQLDRDGILYDPEDMEDEATRIADLFLENCGMYYAETPEGAEDLLGLIHEFLEKEVYHKNKLS